MAQDADRRAAGAPYGEPWWQDWQWWRSNGSHWRRRRSLVRRLLRRRMGRLRYQDVPSPWWWSRPAPLGLAAWIPEVLSLPRCTAMWPANGWHFNDWCGRDVGYLLETCVVPLGNQRDWSTLNPPIIFGLHRFGCPPVDFPSFANNRMAWFRFGCCLSPPGYHFGEPAPPS